MSVELVILWLLYTLVIEFQYLLFIYLFFGPMTNNLLENALCYINNTYHCCRCMATEIKTLKGRGQV